MLEKNLISSVEIYSISTSLPGELSDDMLKRCNSCQKTIKIKDGCLDCSLIKPKSKLIIFISKICNFLSKKVD